MNQKITNTKGSILGFSMLEVLVALTLLALSFTALVLVQARATKLAQQARNISVATQLARYQLMECQREAQKKISSVGTFVLEGDFSDLGYEKFTWDCHAPKFNMKTPSATKTEEQIKKSAQGKAVGAAEGMAESASMASPIMEMVTNTLGDSVRELALIVRWKDGEYDEEVRVVTHVVDLIAMTGLAKMISSGAENFGKKSDKEPVKPDEPGAVPKTE